MDSVKSAGALFEQLRSGLCLNPTILCKNLSNFSDRDGNTSLNMSEKLQGRENKIAYNSDESCNYMAIYSILFSRHQETTSAGGN